MKYIGFNIGLGRHRNDKQPHVSMCKVPTQCSSRHMQNFVEPPWLWQVPHHSSKPLISINCTCEERRVRFRVPPHRQVPHLFAPHYLLDSSNHLL